MWPDLQLLEQRLPIIAIGTEMDGRWSARKRIALLEWPLLTHVAAGPSRSVSFVNCCSSQAWPHGLQEVAYVLTGRLFVVGSVTALG